MLRCCLGRRWVLQVIVADCPPHSSGFRSDITGASTGHCEPHVSGEHQSAWCSYRLAVTLPKPPNPARNGAWLNTVWASRCGTPLSPRLRPAPEPMVLDRACGPSTPPTGGHVASTWGHTRIHPQTRKPSIMPAHPTRVTLRLAALESDSEVKREFATTACSR